LIGPSSIFLNYGWLQIETSLCPLTPQNKVESSTLSLVILMQVEMFSNNMGQIELLRENKDSRRSKKTQAYI